MNFDFHDAKYGPLKKCQISNADDLEMVIDLGHQPLCDSLLEVDQLDLPEKNYPLRLLRSKSLGHGQIDYVVPSDEVYFPEYPYRPGITREVLIHHGERVEEAIKKLNINKGSLVVDIGSNDGTLLLEYKKKGMKVLGVEPTNMAQYAQSVGIDSIQEFFDESSAEKILSKHGNPKIITATNVFAHMSTLGKVMRGIDLLMNNDSYFVFENHYIMNILNENQYDSIYHEHIRSYSLKSIVYLFELYQMKVIDAEVVDRYGGTLRVVVSKNMNLESSQNVKNYLILENERGLLNKPIWSSFAKNVIKTKNQLMELALDAANKNLRFVGKSCPGRSSTLINYVGLNKALMPYITEQSTSLKLGKFLPGKHIPIVDDEVLFREQPDYVIIFAWHYGNEIIKILKNKGLKSKFVLPLPFLKIID